jgi:hypothetical protein
MASASMSVLGHLLYARYARTLYGASAQVRRKQPSGLFFSFLGKRIMPTLTLHDMRLLRSNIFDGSKGLYELDVG